MLFVHQSNRLEQLAERFAKVYAVSAMDPFQVEQVVIQNAGMGRWLSLFLADRLGIAANLEFLFPAEFMWELLRRVLDGLPETAPFSPGPLAWRILAVLERSGDHYPELKSYLTQMNQHGKFQLAKQLEKLFDRYVFYRPEWIQKWESGESSHWQARMWRDLRRDSEAKHWLDLQEQFLVALPKSDGVLPQRVLFFGISELSPGYLRLLGASAEVFDIHFFLVNPCREYWSDIVPEKTKLSADAELEPYLEVGNPLLASMGRQGRDFFDLLLELHADEVKDFINPENDSLLAGIQRDIFELTDKTADQTSVEIDTSLSVHSCHTPVREIEVLHDQILAMLAHDESLQPADIVVMSPSVADYAPAIEAVFSSARNEIPYSIADRTLLDASVSGQILQLLLDIPESRYEVNRLLDLLDYAAVRNKFGLDEDTVDVARGWCEALRVRWSIDGDMRRGMGLPDTDEHSWRKSLERMQMGYMLDDDDMFDGSLPYREIEGSLATDMGRFTNLMEKLFGLRTWRQCQMPVFEWMEKFAYLLNSFINERECAQEIQSIRTALNQWVQQTEQAGYADEIDFLLARKLAMDALSGSGGQNYFIKGGVTFCELVPMRSVPFKVICLIGMNDGKYPRLTQRLSFDQMVDRYRRGDRSPRLEDRYLFLESLLAARQRLYISYVGQSIRDNSEIPSSVLVSELLDYVEAGFGIERNELVTQQPLQAFSRRYLQEEGLFTYAEYGVEKIHQSNESIFADAPLKIKQNEVINLADLEKFIRHPVRHYLREALGLAGERDETELSEREPFCLESFVDREIRQQLDCGEFDRVVVRLRAQGLLPHGTSGDRLAVHEQAMLEKLKAKIPEVEPLAPLRVELVIREKTLIGRLENLTEQGQLWVNYAKPNTYDLLEFWLRHLVLSVSERPCPSMSTLVYPEGKVQLGRVGNASENLQAILSAWEQGQTRPIRFMPKSSLAWAKAKRSTRKDANPQKSAYRVWAGGDYPEGAAAEYRLAFRGIVNLFDNEFDAWSVAIWDGFLDAGGKEQ